MKNEYIIRVGPGTYYAGKDRYLRDRNKAARFATYEEARCLACGWTVVAVGEYCSLEAAAKEACLKKS